MSGSLNHLTDSLSPLLATVLAQIPAILSMLELLSHPRKATGTVFHVFFSFGDFSSVCFILFQLLFFFLIFFR